MWHWLIAIIYQNKRKSLREEEKGKERRKEGEKEGESLLPGSYMTTFSLYLHSGRIKEALLGLFCKCTNPLLPFKGSASKYHDIGD